MAFTTLVVATLVALAAIAAIWANHQILDTGGWVSTSDRMLHDHTIEHRVSEFLAEEVITQVRDQVESAGGELSSGQERLLRTRVPRLTERALRTRRIEALWRGANRAAQRELLAILDAKDPGSEGLEVVLDLDPALRAIASELRYGGFEATVPPLGAGQIQIYREDELEPVQTLLKDLRHSTLPTLIALLVLYAVALGFSWPRLRRGFAGIGASLVAAGVLALLAREVAGHQIVDSLAPPGSARAASEAAWGIATSTVTSVSIGAIVIGALLLLGALLVPLALSAGRGPRTVRT